MKNKRLIILLSIFAFVVLLIVLSSTVFTVRASSVSVEWHVSPLQYLQNQNDNIVADAMQNENIVFYDKNQTIQTLEQKYPYIKVLKIEKKFPNKIVVHVSERYEQYAIMVGQEYYALDETGKVLNLYTSSQFEALSATANRKPIVVSVSGMTIDGSTMQTGKIAQIPRVVTILKEVSTGLKQCGYSETWQIISKIKNISIEFGYVSKLTICTTNKNLDIEISDVNVNLSDKVRFGVNLVYSDALAAASDKTLVVYYGSNGKLASYLKEQ